MQRKARSACKNADLVQSTPVLSLQICQIPTMAIGGSRQGCRRATSAVCPLEQRLYHYHTTFKVVLNKSCGGLMATATVCPLSA